MNLEPFRRFLKKKAKSAHVIENLIGQVGQFEDYVTRERGKGLEAADAQDLQGYVAALEALKPGEARKKVRGLALYYQSCGNTTMAALAADIRARAIAKTRKPFALKDFRGANRDDVAKLEAAGIVHVVHMLDAGRTPEARRRLADETGIPLEAILELVKLSDLSRIGAVKRVRARLYHDAGVDTPAKMARWEPEDLREMLIEFVERTGFDGIAPLPREARNAVVTARKLPGIVEY